MPEHERDQITGAEDDSRKRGCGISGITGLSDLLPDWILSQEGKQHVRNARKEMLLAMRSVLDSAIERQDAGPAPRRTASRVEID